MALVEIPSAHHERAVVRAGDVYIKVETDRGRALRERAATSAATVPAPSVLWSHDGPPALLALSAISGTSLARLGEPSTQPPETWVKAGQVARRLHQSPVPAELTAVRGPPAPAIAELRTWLLDNTPADATVVNTLADFAHSKLHGRSADPVFTHGDLQAEHFIIDDGEVAGVIDWSEAGPGDPLRDIASLTQGHHEYLDAVLAGYGKDIDRDVISGYWALGKLNGVRFMTSHGFDASGDVAALRLFAEGIPGDSIA